MVLSKFLNDILKNSSVNASSRPRLDGSFFLSPPIILIQQKKEIKEVVL